MASIQSKFFQIFFRTFIKKGSLSHLNILKIRWLLKMICSCLKIPPDFKMEEKDMEGVMTEWLIPPNSNPTKLLYYIHGGGFVLGSPRTHRMFVAYLSQALGVRALQVNYRLAPEEPFPAAIEDCFKVYEAVSRQLNPTDNLIMGGDSAGCALAFATLSQARAHELPLPKVIFCLSPLMNLTFENNSIRNNQTTELFFNEDDLAWMRKLYIGSRDPHYSLISPIFGELKGLPPVLIHASQNEALLDDAYQLAQCARKAGVKVELKIWKDLFHAFPLIPLLPESHEVIDDIVKFSEINCN